MWQIQIEMNIRLKTAKKERGLPISENRNVSSRLCRKPSFDENGKTFSFAYGSHRRLAVSIYADNETKKLKRKFPSEWNGKAYLLYDRTKQVSPPANGMYSYHQQTEIFVSVVP